MLLCQYYYSKPPPGVSLTCFFTIGAAISCSALLTLFTSFYISVLLSYPAGSSPDSIARHKTRPQTCVCFTEAIWHGSRAQQQYLFPLCPPVQWRPPRRRAAAEENSVHSHVWLFDRLLYLGTERIGAVQTDWCLDTADDFVCS